MSISYTHSVQKVCLQTFYHIPTKITLSTFDIERSFCLLTLQRFYEVHIQSSYRPIKLIKAKNHNFAKYNVITKQHY